MCEQRMLRRDCAHAQARRSLLCSHTRNNTVLADNEVNDVSYKLLHFSTLNTIFYILRVSALNVRNHYR